MQVLYKSQLSGLSKMKIVFRSVVLLMLGLALPWLSGCNSGGPQMVPIRGIVMYKGAALTDVSQGIVRDLPKGSGSRAREATGRIQPDGSFIMTTFQKDDGVVAGEYDITVSAYSGRLLSRQETESGVHTAGPKLLVPDRYLKPGSSGLSDSVASGHSGFKKIELTDKS
jgi:hypothetical protein